MVNRDGPCVRPCRARRQQSRSHRGCAARRWQISASMSALSWRGGKARRVGVVSQPGGPCPPVLAQPQMHGLPGYPAEAGHLGDRRTGDDFHD
jgi:hypothetical protein